MILIDKIEGIIKQINGNYGFVYETNKLMNVRADDKLFPLVFWEEYTNGSMTVDNYGRKKETRQIELSFQRLAPRDNYQCDAKEREQIREQIKEEIVYAFIDAINECEDFDKIGEFEIVAEPPRFDSVVVSVLLRFTLGWSVC